MNLFKNTVFGIMLSVFAMSPAFADTAPVETTPVAVPAQSEPDTFTAVNLDSQLPGTGYWGFNVGNGFQPQETNKRGNGAFYSLTYGRDLGMYDVEVEGFRTYTDGKPSIGNFDAYGVLLNGKAKWLNTSKFTPYAKLGVGLANISGNGVYDDGFHFVTNYGVGGSYKLAENTNLEVEYNRLWSPVDVRNNAWGRENFQEDVLTVGLNFKY